MSRATIGSARRAARETVHYTKCLKFASEQQCGPISRQRNARMLRSEATSVPKTGEELQRHKV